jgi:hypothetical protein
VRVSSSAMADDSPCRRTPSTMPSSVHSMRGLYRNPPMSAAISPAVISGFDALASPEMAASGYALNQPCASPE